MKVARSTSCFKQLLEPIPRVSGNLVRELVGKDCRPGLERLLGVGDTGHLASEAAEVFC